MTDVLRVENLVSTRFLLLLSRFSFGAPYISHYASGDAQVRRHRSGHSISNPDGDAGGQQGLGSRCWQVGNSVVCLHWQFENDLLGRKHVPIFVEVWLKSVH